MKTLCVPHVYYLRILAMPLLLVLVACKVDISATPAATSNPNTELTSAQTSTAITASTAYPSTAMTSTPTPVNKHKGTITFAFDSFPSYFPSLIMDVKQLLANRGYDLRLIPFLLDGQNDLSEEARFRKLDSGDWDILATTLSSFVLHANEKTGAVTTVIDESAGADKLVAKPGITKINDLAGKRIAYSKGSVGEYFLYYALSLADLRPQDVTLVPKDSVSMAVKAYTEGQADAVSAWVPDVQAAQDAGAQVIIASDNLRAVLDVLVTSRQAIDSKSEAVEAFHDAWFEALKTMVDTPDQAEQAILQWGHSDWTFVEKPGDLKAALEPLAQATLGANQIAFQKPELLVSRLRGAQDIWVRAGQTPTQVDLNQLVEPRFALGSSRNAQLLTSQPPVNSSFLLTADVINLPQLSPEGQQAISEVVKLPLEQIEFEPESSQLKQQSQNDLINQVLPLLKSSRLYLKIEGSAAWPGPVGHFSQEKIRSFAEQRALSVQQFLAQYGIDPNRLIIGTLDPKFPNSINEAELVQDRIVRFTLIKVEGR